MSLSHYGMASVVSSPEACDHVRLTSQPVYHPSLSLIAPLSANYDYCRHTTTSIEIISNVIMIPDRGKKGKSSRPFRIHRDMENAERKPATVTQEVGLRGFGMCPVWDNQLHTRATPTIASPTPTAHSHPEPASAPLEGRRGTIVGVGVAVTDGLCSPPDGVGVIEGIGVEVGVGKLVGIEVLVGGTGVSGSEGVLVGTTGVFVGRPAVGVTPNSGFASTTPTPMP